MSAKQDHHNFNYRNQATEYEAQTYYYPNIPANSTYSPSGNYGSTYNNLPFSQHHMPQNQNCCLTDSMCTFQTDCASWDTNKTFPEVDTGVRIPDKVNMNEISSKDLSPASHSSTNIDLMVSEISNYNRYDNQWFYPSEPYNNYSHRNIEFTSCAQINKNSSQEDKSTRYYGGQKICNRELTKSCVYYQNTNNIDIGNYKNNDIRVQGGNSYESYGSNLSMAPAPMLETNYYCTSFVDPIDQQTEISNDESDIIVEESDEDQTDFSEDQERKLYQVNKCLVCNVIYTPIGLQFYFLTLQNPLTMSSQTPVLQKLFDVVGTEISPKNYLCSTCLGLLNSIDHLQLKLENFIKDIRLKFYNTCHQNGIQVNGVTKTKNTCEQSEKKCLIKKISKFRCPICQKIMCLKRYYLHHLTKHKRPGVLCELCGTICKTRKSFVFHSKKHISSNFKIPAFKCTNCEKIFRTRSNLKEHQHFCLGLLPFICKNQYCDKKFASANKLKNHMKLKHDKKFIAICSICNIGFVKVSNYKSHMVSHSTAKKYSCKKCDKSYKTLGNLNFHMKLHNKTLPFICEICQKGFMRKEYLESHMNNHKGIKNFTCTVCPKKFVSQKNLDAHLKYHEGSEKNTTCNICGKTVKSGLQDHLRVHSNLAEFECYLCDMKFNTKGTLAKHKKRKHSEAKSFNDVLKNRTTVTDNS